MEETEKKERLWNRNFVKMCIGNFMLFFAFYLIVPLLPLYLKDTFNADKQMIGFVLSGYILTAMIVRPFGGFMVDSFPRKQVLLICYFLFFIFFAGYVIAGTLLLFAIIRTLHGFSFGSLTVANSTVAIDVLYPSRRAEGIGYYGLSNNLAMATGPTVALYIYAVNPNFDILFWLSLITSGIGLVVVSTIKTRPRDAVREKQPLSLDRFFLLKGMRAGTSLACFSFAYGVLSTYLAIYGKEEIGITSGTGTFFMLMAIGLMMSRLVGSRTLRLGKITQNAAVGACLSLLGYLLFDAIHEPWAYYSAAVIIGLGNGHMCPAYQTMFINLAPNSQRGTANSTFLTSWDVGIGLGIFVGGIVAEKGGYHDAFWAAFAINMIGVIVFYALVSAHYNKFKMR